MSCLSQKFAFLFSFLLLVGISKAQNYTGTTNMPIVLTTTTTTPTEATNTAVTSTIATITTTIIAAATTEEPNTSSTTTTTAVPKNVEETPKYFTANDVPTCRQNDEKLSDCVKRIFEIVLPRFKNGNKQLNIPAIDPFVMNRTTLQYTNGGVHGRITLPNATVYGFGDIQQKSLNFKVAKGKTKAHLLSLVPKMQIIGSYKAEMAINNVHFRPKGNFNVTLINVKLYQKSEGVLYTKDNHTFVALKKLNVDPKVSDFKIQANGIFPDPSLNEIVLNLINQYWREIYRIILPETRRYWAPALLRITNEALSLVPFDNFVKTV